MTIKIVGKHVDIKRVVTGLYSLDRACTNDLGAIGLPIGTGYELFGLTGTGKSTLSYSLAGMLGKSFGDIALGDFEGFDKPFLTKVLENQGFSGDVHLAYEKEDEKQLDKFINLMDTKCAVGIIDSIGAIATVGEAEGELGERNMGGRGFIMAQFSRKLLKLFRFHDDKTVFMTNHWYPKLGAYGYVTPGGEVKKYIATVRIKLQRDNTFPEGSYTLVGTVVKNRWGYQDRTFSVFILAGYGLHAGMTALWDCINLKLVKMVKSGKKAFTLSIDDEEIGKLGYFARLAKEGNIEIFVPFYKLLEEYNGKNETENKDVHSETDTVPATDNGGESLDD